MQVIIAVMNTISSENEASTTAQGLFSGFIFTAAQVVKIYLIAENSRLFAGKSFVYLRIT